MSALTIVRLVVKDFKRITAIEVEPKSTGLVRVRGRNAQGKSSVLDAIEAAICGKRATPGQPVRAGAERAEINVDCGAVRIRCRLTANGGRSIKVESADPNQKQTQGALDLLYKQVSVDPGAFIRLPQKEQAEQMLAAMGIDTAPLDQARRDTFDERTALGRERDRLEGAFKSAVFPDGPDQPVDVAALLRELEEAEATQDEFEKAEAECDRDEKSIEITDRQIADMEAALAELRKERKVIEAQLAGSRQWVKNAQSALIDPGPIKDRIATASTTNDAVRARQAYRELSRQVGEKDDAYERLTHEIQGIDAEKERLLSEARFPIPGVRLQGETITLNHVPLDQASQAERLRFATALAIALKPDMPVILIRDGSLLDDDSMQALEEMAVNAGAQVWIEEVGSEAGDDAILIEDGALVEVAS